MLDIKKRTVSDLEAEHNFVELVEAYARESAIEGLPSPKGKLALYKSLEAGGSIFIAAAYFDKLLIGFIAVLAPENLHYGVRLAVAESFFVMDNQRKTGAGIKLRQAAEEYAASAGSPGLFISAPVGSVLAYILPHVGYAHTNEVFFKLFKKDLAVSNTSVPAMSEIAINKVRQLEAAALLQPQENVETDHLIHAGMYARTIKIPAKVLLTGALVKRATILIVMGDVAVRIGDVTKRLTGYNVLSASANRKQAFNAIEDTYLTMIFATDIKTIEEAEDQFTEEAHLLLSRKPNAVNRINITGE